MHALVGGTQLAGCPHCYLCYLSGWGPSVPPESGCPIWKGLEGAAACGVGGCCGWWELGSIDLGCSVAGGDAAVAWLPPPPFGAGEWSRLIALVLNHSAEVLREQMLPVQGWAKALPV